MKLSWKEGVERGTRRTTKRIERARKHNKLKSSGYNPAHSTCWMCGGQMTWCSCCEVWSSNCCCDYGTCMCS